MEQQDYRISRNKSAARVYLKNQDLQSEALVDLFLEFGIGLNIYCQQLQQLIEDMASASAGCLIGRLWEEHVEFMQRVKSDRRYLFDAGFVFPTTIIDHSIKRNFLDNLITTY
jgi:hypothetical protein